MTEQQRRPGSLTVAQAIALGRQLLSTSASDTPALDAEVLLRHVLGVDRAALLTHPERVLTSREETAYRALLDRRARDEPVAYLTGHREFMGLDFHVDRRALIPRPDTEVLVERALGHVSRDGSGATVVDVGTGSGAIAISIAALRPAARVFATDVSPEALAVARENASRLLHAPAAVTFLQGSLLEPLMEQPEAPAMVICANLPYIPAPQMATLPRTVRDFEPTGALDGGDDGLDLYRALLRQAPNVLAREGALLMECDPDQAGPLLDMALRAIPRAQGEIVKDLAGLQRVVEVVRGPVSGPAGEAAS